MVKYRGAAEERIISGIKTLAEKQGLRLDTSNPAQILLNRPTGEPSLLLLYTLEDSAILASYESRNLPAPDLGSLLALRGDDLVFTACPAASSEFSPPTFYD